MMYKHGGDIHRAVKEKSMHHRAMRKRGGATNDEASEVNDKEYGGGEKNEEPDAEVSYSGKSPVTDEAHGAEDKKRGGKVKKKAGGKVEHKKEAGKVEGEEKRHRMDRPGRKRGGGIGADKTPLTTAATTKDRRGPSPGDDTRGITGES